MKGNRGPRPPLLSRLVREKIRLPAALLLCVVFFLAGFFVSLLISSPSQVVLGPQDPVGGGRLTRSRLLELDDEDPEWPPMPHGKTGDSSPSLIPFQVFGNLFDHRLHVSNPRFYTLKNT
ncbi:hypothetical protein B296_00038924 [Ensete ventricosum]|uniref:Uncharacterized protein n=1 Tax=Ensete ventricosum TaxID=4639 RepID=A0A426ZUY5_ENSVE|nr:hypothetical protein B296_00038924 [Ensete ventricosum]